MYKNIDINETIKENIGLVYEVINRNYFDKRYEFAKEDMVQVGLISLYKAIQTFDESKNLKFSTFATSIIKNDLCNFIQRDYKRYSGVLDDSVSSINENLDKDGEGNNSIESTLSMDEDFSELEGLELLTYIRERKSEKVVRMVELLAQGYTNEEVGNILGCSKQNVNATMKRLAEELRSSSFMAYQIIKGK